MSPLAHPDGFDAGGLVDQLVPSITAMIDNFVVGFEDVPRDVTGANDAVMNCETHYDDARNDNEGCQNDLLAPGRPPGPSRPP